MASQRIAAIRNGNTHNGDKNSPRAMVRFRYSIVSVEDFSLSARTLIRRQILWRR